MRIPLSDLREFTRLQVKKTQWRRILGRLCRYPGSPFDRDLADSIFEPMWEQVKADTGDHVLLVDEQSMPTPQWRPSTFRSCVSVRSAVSRTFRRNTCGGCSQACRLMALDDHEFDDNWPECK